MFAKFGRVCVCDSLDDLPLRDMEVGDQIVLLEKRDDLPESAEKVVHLIFHRRYKNFLSFVGRAAGADERGGDYDEDGKKIGDWTAYHEDLGVKHRMALVLPDGKVFHFPEVSYGSIEDIPFAEFDLDKLMNNNVMCQLAHHVYESPAGICRSYAETGYFQFGYGGMMYLLLPLSADFVAVATLLVTIPSNYHGYMMYRSTHLALLGPDRAFVASFDVDKQTVEDLAEAFLASSPYWFREMNENAVRKFVEAVELFFLGNLQTRKRFDEIERHLERMLSVKVRNGLHVRDPFYENQSLGVRAFPVPFDNGFFLFGPDGEVIGRPILDGECAGEIGREFRKAAAMYVFLTRGRCGINPENGDYCVDGKVEDDRVYRTSYGVLVPHRFGSNSHYVKLDEYFVPATNEEKDIVERLENEYKLFRELAEI